MDKQESRSVGTILWRRKWIVVAAAILALGVSIAVSVVQTPQYRAQAELVRDRGSIDVTLFGTAIYQSGDAQRDLITTARLLASQRVAVLVKEETGSPLTTQQLLGMVEAKAATDSNTIAVELTGPDPREAAVLAESFANQTIALRQESDKASLVLARQALETQVAMMTPADLESTLGQELVSRIEQLRILEKAQTGGYSLWQSAQIPQSPVSPRPFRDAMAGLAVGVILGLVLAIGTDRMDRRLRDYVDFEREFQLPVLAVIPRTGRTWKRDYDNSNGFIGFSDADSPTIESYRLLRSNLQYFEVEKGLRSILITSGLPQEAKTSTAVNLALGLAMSGARVALVDSDLRNPLMHRYLRLDNRVGLSTLLAGTSRVEDAVKVVRSAAFLPTQQRGGRGAQPGESSLQQDFLCLTSGPLPPNPAELLASPRMGDILRSLMTLADYVLIDSAPILLVADAVTLAPRVEGVIIVSRATSATIDQAHEIRNILERVGARLVGLVITDAKVSGRHGYKRGYYQTSS